MVSTAKPTKRQRRLGIRVIPKLDKYVARRPYPPGVHGQRRPSQPSDYSLQLLEKQRIKFIYGLRERQLRRFFAHDPKSILSTLERRIDNVVFRAGFANTRAQGRQLVLHRHFLVNDQRVNIPSYLVRVGDKLKPRRPDTTKLQEPETPPWLSLDKKTKTVTVKKIPTRDDITSEINEQLIIEYFSR